MFFFDIGAIDSTFERYGAISIEKFNLFSFRRTDYLNDEKGSLEKAARELVSKKCGFYPKGKIYLLTNLACLGYCFNPISIYFVFRQDSDDIEALIVEVTNTPWSEKHIYVQGIEKNNRNKKIYTCRFRKELHVSPFLGMDYEYSIHFRVDDEKIIVNIENFQRGEKHFDATLSLQASQAEPKENNRLLLRHIFMTHKISAAIYWQALQLWLKGVSFHSHPDRQ